MYFYQLPELDPLWPRSISASKPRQTKEKSRRREILDAVAAPVLISDFKHALAFLNKTLCAVTHDTTAALYMLAKWRRARARVCVCTRVCVAFRSLQQNPPCWKEATELWRVCSSDWESPVCLTISTCLSLPWLSTLPQTELMTRRLRQKHVDGHSTTRRRAGGRLRLSFVS